MSDDAHDAEREVSPEHPSVDREGEPVRDHPGGQPVGSPEHKVISIEEHKRRRRRGPR